MGHVMVHKIAHLLLPAEYKVHCLINQSRAPRWRRRARYHIGRMLSIFVCYVRQGTHAAEGILFPVVTILLPHDCRVVTVLHPYHQILSDNLPVVVQRFVALESGSEPQMDPVSVLGGKNFLNYRTALGKVGQYHGGGRYRKPEHRNPIIRPGRNGLGKVQVRLGQCWGITYEILVPGQWNRRHNPRNVEATLVQIRRIVSGRLGKVSRRVQGSSSSTLATGGHIFARRLEELLLVSKRIEQALCGRARNTGVVIDVSRLVQIGSSSESKFLRYPTGTSTLVAKFQRLAGKRATSDRGLKGQRSSAFGRGKGIGTRCGRSVSH